MKSSDFRSEKAVWVTQTHCIQKIFFLKKSKPSTHCTSVLQPPINGIPSPRLISNPKVDLGSHTATWLSLSTWVSIFSQAELDSIITLNRILEFSNSLPFSLCLSLSPSILFVFLLSFQRVFEFNRNQNSITSTSHISDSLLCPLSSLKQILETKDESWAVLISCRYCT